MPQTTVLHENVLKLLPTLDALVFAVDSSEVENNNEGGGGGMKFFRDELGLSRAETREHLGTQPSQNR